MQNKRNKKYKSEKIITILTCIIVLGLFSLGYAMRPSSNDDSDVITRITDFQKADIITDAENDIIIEPKEGRGKAPPSDIKEAEVPTITIGDINPEHKNDPDYITYEINIIDAKYTVEEDGKLVEKEIPNIINGSISIKRDQTQSGER